MTTVTLPSTSRIVDFCATPSFADAYAIDLPEHASGDPEHLARFVFARRSAWMGALMRIRDAIVGVFGLKTAAMLQRPGADRERRVGLFRIYEKTRDEIVLGEDDSHLDFRLSVLRA
ncbi:MAG TPA: DUF2867 domain-containing protein, partial [Tahibacter sp.]|nr:DUF2867 domain-containing protein [Tahibacter sp.]